VSHPAIKGFSDFVNLLAVGGTGRGEEALMGGQFEECSPSSKLERAGDRYPMTERDFKDSGC
jgi:hypothetical protein